MPLARTSSSVASRCCQRTAGTSSSASTCRAISFCTSRISFSARSSDEPSRTCKSERLRLPLHAPDQMRIISVIDLRHDDADEPAAAQAQILRGAIRDVVAPPGLGLHARLCADADVGRVAQRLGTAMTERFNDAAISFSVDIAGKFLAFRA